jgi:hypothetical protein
LKKNKLEELLNDPILLKYLRVQWINYPHSDISLSAARELNKTAEKKLGEMAEPTGRQFRLHHFDFISKLYLRILFGKGKHRKILNTLKQYRKMPEYSKSRELWDLKYRYIRNSSNENNNNNLKNKRLNKKCNNLNKKCNNNDTPQSPIYNPSDFK